MSAAASALPQRSPDRAASARAAPWCRLTAAGAPDALRAACNGGDRRKSDRHSAADESPSDTLFPGCRSVQQASAAGADRSPCRAHGQRAARRCFPSASTCSSATFRACGPAPTRHARRRHGRTGTSGSAGSTTGRRSPASAARAYWRCSIANRAETFSLAATGDAAAECLVACSRRSEHRKSAGPFDRMTAATTTTRSTGRRAVRTARCGSRSATHGRRKGVRRRWHMARLRSPDRRNRHRATQADATGWIYHVPDLHRCPFPRRSGSSVQREQRTPVALSPLRSELGEHGERCADPHAADRLSEDRPGALGLAASRNRAAGGSRCQ